MEELYPSQASETEMNTPPSDYENEEKVSTYVFKTLLAYIGAVLCMISICVVLWCGILSVTFATQNRSVKRAIDQIEPLPAKTPPSSPIPVFPTATFSPDHKMQVSEKDGMVMVYVAAGEFLMGNENGHDNEQPVHAVYLDAFWIDQTEVTNKQYMTCVNEGACNQPSKNSSFRRDHYFGNPEYDNFPVIYVSWYDAASYCDWAGRRLPTEAEWEKAARDGDRRIYPWGNATLECSLANYENPIGSCGADTLTVGKHESGISPYGAQDMAGNVWEWVNDWYDYEYYSHSQVYNPPGPDSGLYRVIRGGAWSSIPYDVRSSNRVGDIAKEGYDDVGFRCASPFRTGPYTKR